MKEPGQLAYEAHEAQYVNQPDRPWRIVDDAERAVWAAVEAAVRDAVLEEAAGAVEKRAVERGRQECCGFGIGSPPECCGDPLYMIDDCSAAAAIRALKGGEQ